MNRVLRYVVGSLGLAVLALACSGGGGGTAAAPQAVPIIAHFAAGLPFVSAGTGTTLDWTVNGATSLTIDQGIGTVTGTSLPVSPLVTTTYTLTAANAAGQVAAQAKVTVRAVPPSGMVYIENPAIYTKDASIPMNEPYYSGDEITLFSVAPELPSGLALDPDYGYITGTPTVIASTGTYTITGSNSGGRTSTDVVIRVDDVAPSFGYGAGQFSFTTGTAIAALTPEQTGGAVVTWSISPSLPAGLVFSLLDGGIRGKPTAITASTGYTVTGTNSGGTQLASFTLRTPPPAPSISLQPTNTTANVGETATFSMAASGTGTLGYQWSMDGVDIPGAIDASYTTPVTRLADSGAAYRVVVSDPYGGTVTSATAILTATSDLTAWLNSHPSVATAIRWQSRPSLGDLGAYQPPADADIVDWTRWTQDQKSDLDQAYQDAKAWFALGANQVAMDPSGLTDEPVNQHPQSLPNPPSNDNVTVMEWVTPAYMWKLYLAHVAFALAQEIAHPLPWSLTGDSAESLRYLLDSSVMAWYLPNGNFGMGTYGGVPPPNFPVLRALNRPQTAFGPPMWTYPWLRQAGLIGATRLETIGLVLDWMRHNMAHFNGIDTFGVYNNVWQYRGFAPLSQVVNGTLDATDATHTLRHWTAGCHGSVGFLHAVLRVLNIPVQPVWIGGHELACFTTERLYLDHGDDPYNADVRALPEVPILDLLIDESTYQTRFTSDLTLNITDLYSQAAKNVGYMTTHFH